MKTIGVTKQTNNKYLNLFDLKLDNGSNYFVASRRNTEDLAALNPEVKYADAVAVLAEYRDSVVFIKQTRPAVGKAMYELPAGLVDPGESVAVAAARELLEETGLRVKSYRKIMPPKYTSPGMTDETIALVYVTCYEDCEPTINNQTGGEEILGVELVKKQDLEEFFAVCDTGIKAELAVRAFIMK